MHEYGVKLTSIDDVKDADCIIIAVAHKQFREFSLDQIKALYKDTEDEEKILLDVKGIYKVEQLEKSGLSYWRL